MSEKKGYNGWVNYPTWNVALWIGNEQHLQQMWECDRPAELYADAVREQMDGYEFEPGEKPEEKVNREEAKSETVNALAEELKNWANEQSDEMLESAGQSSSFFADLLGYAIGEVDFYEIATNYVSDIDHDAIEKEQADDFRIEKEDETEPDEVAGE